jgi:hypothetical protein
MTTKRKLQEEFELQKGHIKDLEQDNALLRLDIANYKQRLRLEFARHTPKIPDRFWQNDVAESPGKTKDFICSFDDCGFYWPCPTWATLRRIAGKDDSAESLVISLEKE